MGVEKIFCGGPIVDCFQGLAKRMFPRGAKSYFTNSKLREKHFFIKTLIAKNKISKSRDATPLPMPMLTCIP